MSKIKTTLSTLLNKVYSITFDHIRPGYLILATRYVVVRTRPTRGQTIRLRRF
jgi:hypothetical protein